MKTQPRTLSSPIEDIDDAYDVVIVGSGYGGSIAASRLARAGRRVCLLERGREIPEGQFPETPEAFAEEVQVDAEHLRLGSPQALFDVRVNPTVNVVVGCGLGGTSLVNAGVALRPKPDVFRDGRWPRALADDLGVLDRGYALAEEMLGSTPYPASYPKLDKLAALEVSARAMGRDVVRPPINVSFSDHTNRVGVARKACTLCGNCAAGCNDGAKSTLPTNYLADAKNHGASIFTGARARWIEKRGARWVVHFVAVGSGQETYDAPTQFVLADVVVLAAGTLGSTELLLRSREKGLALSKRLGCGFTSNGDMFAFAYNSDREVNGLGSESDDPKPPIGPTITGLIDLRQNPNPNDDVIVEEGAIPAAIVGPVSDALFAFAVAEDVAGGNFAPPKDRTLLQAARATQTLLLMAFDDDKGELVLDDDRVRVDWPDAGKQKQLIAANERAEQASNAIGGTFLRNPVWTNTLGDRLVSVHPLGGCTMGDDATKGVVDDRCRVFAGESGTGVHEGLYVCDGSVVPSPLGVNPLLTISAITERAMSYLAGERRWLLDTSLPFAAPRATTAATPGLRFAEEMKGSATVDGATTDFEFVVTIVIEDLARFLVDPMHVARTYGTARAPGLSPEPLTLTHGTLDLFEPDPDKAGAKALRYRMRATTEDGRSYWLDGIKHVGDDSILHAYRDLTTLYLTVHDGPGPSAPIAGSGVLTIGIRGVLELASTIRAINAGGLVGDVETIAKLGRFLFGSLWDLYGPHVGSAH